MNGRLVVAAVTFASNREDVTWLPLAKQLKSLSDFSARLALTGWRGVRVLRLYIHLVSCRRSRRRHLPSLAAVIIPQPVVRAFISNPYLPPGFNSVIRAQSLPLCLHPMSVSLPRSSHPALSPLVLPRKPLPLPPFLFFPLSLAALPGCHGNWGSKQLSSATQGQRLSSTHPERRSPFLSCLMTLFT